MGIASVITAAVATGRIVESCQTSDIDFVVDLGDYGSSVAERYLDLIAALTDVLRYRVEMITETSIRNPYFRAAVDEQRVTIYESGNGKAAA